MEGAQPGTEREKRGGGLRPAGPSPNRHHLVPSASVLPLPGLLDDMFPRTVPVDVGSEPQVLTVVQQYKTGV